MPAPPPPGYGPAGQQLWLIMSQCITLLPWFIHISSLPVVWKQRQNDSKYNTTTHPILINFSFLVKADVANRGGSMGGGDRHTPTPGRSDILKLVGNFFIRNRLNAV